MQTVTVLLVGLIRNQHVLMRSVENLAVARERGVVKDIILVTWKNEIEKIRHLLPRLEAAGVLVRGEDEPVANPAVPANFMYQMRGIDFALETVEDTAWVLRARPDLLVDFDMVASLAAADMSLDEPAGAPLAHKIWTPFAELCQPMCMCDVAFYGHYKDIVRLQNFDSFHEVAGTNLGSSMGLKPVISYDSEIRRYTPAFFFAYPVLQEFYRISNRFFLGIHQLRRAMLAMLYDEEFYWQYMAVYFEILRKYFWIGRDLVEGPVLLARSSSFDQTEAVGCIDFSRCEYARRTIAGDPDLAASKALFSEAPIYAVSSDDVTNVYRHLERIGVPWERRLADALNYRKDAARILALLGFRQRLLATLDGGYEEARIRAPEWHLPFATRFLSLP